MGELQAELQRLSSTKLDAQGAANAWAGTTGRDLVGALNAKNGTIGLGLAGVLNALAGTTGLGVNGAAAAIAGTVTYTIYADAPAGGAMLFSQNGVYATAAAGSNVAVGATNPIVGQYLNAGNYTLNEGFLSFDTSTIAGTIQSATLYLYASADGSATDFTVNARLYDWGAAVDVTDWRTPAQLTAPLPLLATWSTAGYQAAYNQFTSQAAMVSNINRAGKTKMVLSSSRQEAQSAPSGFPGEYVTFTQAATLDTSTYPKLVVVAA